MHRALNQHEKRSERRETLSHTGRLSAREDFRRALIAFVEGPLSGRHRRKGPDVRIDGTTPLFKSGLIDSLGILDLLAFVEQCIGASIPHRKVDMKYFGTIDAICEAFWTPETEGGSS